MTPDERGNYSTKVFTREANRVIRQYSSAAADNNATKPLFLYLAYYAPHQDCVIQGKEREEYLARYENNTEWSRKRKLYAATVTAVDDGIGQVVKQLKAHGLWENSLVIVTTDNGGRTDYGGKWSPASGDTVGGASNFPLRGAKFESFEGAIKGDALLAGPALDSLAIAKSKPCGDLFHALDWFPTLAEVAGVEPREGSASLDGVSQLETLRGGGPSRTEFHCGFGQTRRSRKGMIPNQSPYCVGEAAYRGPDQMKLIDCRTHDHSLLYDLSDDEREELDLSLQYNSTDYLNVTDYLKSRMQQVELNFKEFRLPRCSRPLSYGRTPWGQPAHHPYCSEPAACVPRGQLCLTPKKNKCCNRKKYICKKKTKTAAPRCLVRTHFRCRKEGQRCSLKKRNCCNKRFMICKKPKPGSPTRCQPRNSARRQGI